MSRQIGYLALLCLAGAAFVLPLSAEEITVTIPPDPPAQTAPASQDAAPAEPAAQQQPLPSFGAGEAVRTPVAQDTTTPPAAVEHEAAPPAAPEPSVSHQSQATESASPPAVAPEAPKPTEVEKAPAAAQAATDTTAGSPPAASHARAHAETPAAKPKAKAKAKKVHAAASCKGLDETACGKNSACIWVVSTKAEGTSKGTSAQCRSLAILKKEAKKADKAGKSKEPEVLPWAQHTTTTTKSGAGVAATTGSAPADGKAP